MPWFKIDDKAHSHPKLIRAGNAALGLWLRCGSYAAQHLTEGIVPGVVAELYGSRPQAAKLVKAGLWHEHGHNCPSGCPDPNPGDYVFHDFLEDGRNTSRARYEADKKKARDRQAKHRESAAGGENASGKKKLHDESSSKNSEIALEKTEISGSVAGQDHESRRDDSVTGIHAAPAPYPGTSYGSTAAAREQPRGLPDPLGELKTGIAAAGLSGVGWDLRESQWEYTRQALERVGPAAMIAYAINSARLKGTPAGASAWVQGWRSLQPAPENGVAYLPATASNTGPQQPPSHNASVIARFRQRNQEPT